MVCDHLNQLQPVLAGLGRGALGTLRDNLASVFKEP